MFTDEEITDLTLKKAGLARGKRKTFLSFKYNKKQNNQIYFQFSID
jgi:hypothetical protein